MIVAHCFEFLRRKIPYNQEHIAAETSTFRKHETSIALLLGVLCYFRMLCDSSSYLGNQDGSVRRVAAGPGHVAYIAWCGSISTISEVQTSKDRQNVVRVLSDPIC